MWPNHRKNPLEAKRPASPHTSLPERERQEEEKECRSVRQRVRPKETHRDGTQGRKLKVNRENPEETKGNKRGKEKVRSGERKRAVKG